MEKVARRWLLVCAGMTVLAGACLPSSQPGSAGHGGSGGHVGGGMAGAGGALGDAGSAGGAGSSGAAGSQGQGGAGPADASSDGSGDGRTDDGAADGIGGAGGQGAAACAGLFCEDFESGSFDPAVWDVKTFTTQTATVQDKLVAHGKYAAQFHGNPNLLSYALITTKNLPAALHGHHFGRAYFYASPNRPSGHLTLVFAGTAEVPNARKYLEVAETNEKWQLTWVSFAPGNGAAAGSSAQEAYSIGDAKSPDSPSGKWVCLEWEFNDTPDEVRVFVDGAQAWAYAPISFQNASSGLVGGFADVAFGYYIWHPGSTSFDVYYDDIVLDTKRVGCLRDTP